MQSRAEQTSNEGNNYISNFPKLKDFAKMRGEKIYQVLGQIQSSEYFGLCSGQIRALIEHEKAI